MTLPTIEHAGALPDLREVPAYLHGDDGPPASSHVSCSYCGVGDGGTAVDETSTEEGATVTLRTVTATAPTAGCVKLRLSAMRQRAAFPIHIAPSVLEGEGRRTVSYEAAIAKLADLLLAHRAQTGGRTLLYACGQIDYFSIFAIQEVMRLLGVRNLTGNAEHCLNAGAVHNEMLTGQEGPFLTLKQAATGPNRFFLMNGWNGFVSHPPAFQQIQSRPDFDGFLVEVAVTESAKAVAKKLGPERVLLIRPRADPHLGLAVAHELLTHHPHAVHRGFIDRFADGATFDSFRDLAASPRFDPERVAERIAPEPGLVERLWKGIRTIAFKLAQPEIVPINIPSVGLSQTSGAVAHCVWGSVLAMLGKYGLQSPGVPAGGTLRLPGQINAESEVQGLSRKYFMGRIPVDRAAEAARRMGLPDDAYAGVVTDTPRAALDYGDPTPGTRELFLCFGTQFESNVMDRLRFLRKLEDPANSLAVVDPIPDPYTVAHADLILPSPPHPATPKLYQNGEWRLTLSMPQKQAAPETRSDATILYDAMAEIGRRLETDPALAETHADLAAHARSGYLRERFGDGLPRHDGEVSRAALWARVQAYMTGGSGPIYCTPAHGDGSLIRWEEILERGSLIYGGVGERRFLLDYEDPEATPYRDIWGARRAFRFFTPTEIDLEMPEGLILTSGRSSLSDDRERVRFATSTFNSGKATPLAGMPDENPLFVSAQVAERSGLKHGGRARVINRSTGHAIEAPVIVSDRVKGDTMYMSFHKAKAEVEEGRYINTVTSHEGRCPYTAQTTVKATQVLVERVEARIEPGRRLDTTHIDPSQDLPIWSGQGTPLHVTDVLQETHDVFTFRMQGDPLCRFVYQPGQFCTLVLPIDGKKVVRSYSISSTPTRPFVLEVTVKRIPGGLVSNWLPDNLKPGSRIEITGPKGKFCLTPGKIPKKILFLAAGSGITPLFSMARWLCDVSADVDVSFLNCVRTPQDIIFEKEIEMMAARYRQFSAYNISNTRAPGSTWTGLRGRISRPMLELSVPDLHERHVYMVGPQGFMDGANAIFAEMGFDLANLHSESFGGLRTSAHTKLAPVGTEVAEDAAETGAFEVEFARSGKLARTGGKQSLLELAEDHDVDIGYACRTGNCGECKARLLKGEVASETNAGLTTGQQQEGYVLTCVSRPKGSCTVDA